MINQILNVFKKERLDFLRDRRTVFASLAFAILGPLVLVAMFNYIASMAEDETQPNLAIKGAEYAPNLVLHIKGRGVIVSIIEEEVNPDQILTEYDAFLEIDEDYATNLEGGRLARLNLYLDRGNVQTDRRAQEVQRNIMVYGRIIANSRLLTMGVPSSLTTPIAVDIRDISIAGARAKSMSYGILFYFLLAPFYSSMSISIDVTAGERERKSLQTLLAQPVTPASLILGKWALAAGFGMLGTTISVLGGMFAIGISPIEILGMRLHLDFATQLQLLVVLFPLCWLVAGAQILVALTAKSYKEANAYLQIMSILPVIIGTVTIIRGTEIEGLMAYAPIFSHLQLTQDLLINGQGNWGLIALASIVSIILAAVALVFTSKRLGHEKILSGA